MSSKLIFPLIFLAAWSCQSQKKKDVLSQKQLTTYTASTAVNQTYPQSPAEAGLIRLKEGQTHYDEKTRMNLTFLKTLSDNRCPMNARCIQAGQAIVEIEVMTPTSRPRILKLATFDSEKEQVARSASFAGHRLTLHQLYPANSTDVGYEKLKGRYIIDLKVEKITSESPSSPPTPNRH